MKVFTNFLIVLLIASFFTITRSEAHDLCRTDKGADPYNPDNKCWPGLYFSLDNHCQGIAGSKDDKQSPRGRCIALAMSKPEVEFPSSVGNACDQIYPEGFRTEKPRTDRFECKEHFAGLKLLKTVGRGCLLDSNTNPPTEREKLECISLLKDLAVTPEHLRLCESKFGTNNRITNKLQYPELVFCLKIVADPRTQNAQYDKFMTKFQSCNYPGCTEIFSDPKFWAGEIKNDNLNTANEYNMYQCTKQYAEKMGSFFVDPSTTNDLDKRYENCREALQSTLKPGTVPPAGFRR